MPRWLLPCIALLGCQPALGPCDTGAALEVVYDAAGSPAFAGQAQMIRSCGPPGTCHAAATPEDRLGAPEGLDLDVRVASLSSQVEGEELERLAEHQANALRERRTILGLVGPGREHPAGRAPPPSLYDRVADDGVTYSPVPGLDTEEGYEIFRNWLSCGVPVVERTEPRRDRRGPSVGFLVPFCARRCVDVTWPDIYERVVVPSCTFSRCHDETDPPGGLDYLTSGAAGVHARVIDVVPTSLICGPRAVPYVTPGGPESSLLYLKVSSGDARPICGSRMPQGGAALPDQWICAIRVWIECGACPEADGGTCRSCVESRRSECDIDLASATQCSSPPSTCPNSL